MDEIEFIHLWGDNGTCYSCDTAPGTFIDETEISEYEVEVRHLCRDCMARR